MDLAAFIDRYDRAWNDQDVDAIMSMHTADMVFENHTRGVRAEGAAVRELLESTDAEGRAIEWDGIDVFPFRDGLIARKDVYSGSHAPRVP